MYHDFSTSFCEIKLKMVIRNTSDGFLSVSINTIDGLPDAAAPTPSSGNLSGWRYVPAITEEMKLTSDVMGSRLGKPPPSMESSPPFIWSGSSSTKVQIQPLSTTEIPLQVSVFSPGTYSLSTYELVWELFEHENASSATSGTCQGYPYYITVLQSEWNVISFSNGWMCPLVCMINLYYDVSHCPLCIHLKWSLRMSFQFWL